MHRTALNKKDSSSPTHVGGPQPRHCHQHLGPVPSLLWGYSAHCSMFSCTWGLYPLDTRSTPLKQVKFPSRSDHLEGQRKQLTSLAGAERGYWCLITMATSCSAPTHFHSPD